MSSLRSLFFSDFLDLPLFVDHRYHAILAIVQLIGPSDQMRVDGRSYVLEAGFPRIRLACLAEVALHAALDGIAMLIIDTHLDLTAGTVEQSGGLMQNAVRYHIDILLVILVIWRGRNLSAMVRNSRLR